MSKFFKILLIFFISFLFFLNFSKNLYAYNSKNIKFIVTAYYSPLPNQKHYITGSYSGDKRLNGEGHTTASGKKPFSGVLAAPKKYPFGTKIYFEGYGIGSVEDRGGAIVKAGVRGQNYDRIDIWMGYGDEGLARAKKWGKRILYGRVIDSSNKVNLKFSKNILSGLENIKVNPEVHKKQDVIILQEKFKQLGLYNGKIDGNYNSIKNTLINFQLKNYIIKSKKDQSAGWFGPKTYTMLLKKFQPNDVLIKQNNLQIKETNPKIEIILQAPEIKLNGDNPQLKEVKKVQELFKKLGLYNGKINGNYNSIKNIILKIQKQAGIIKKDTDWGAGYFGEKTKAALIRYLEDQYEQSFLNSKDKKTLNKIIYKIKKYIEKKSNNNIIKQKILKRKIENKLTQILVKTNNKKLKYKINYLLNNI